MLQQRLTKLKDFILTHNTYFKTGFDSVFMDSQTGIVNNDKAIVFPADDIGNYFYLRLPSGLGADYGNQYIISDCAKGVGVRYEIILVAIVDGADGSLLVENMLTTLMRYNNEELKITKAIYQAEDVIMQELAKIPKEDKESALQRFSTNEYGICSIHFTFTVPFVAQQLSCIQNPCRPC